jgi:replicative DNA helicase
MNAEVIQFSEDAPPLHNLDIEQIILGAIMNRADILDRLEFLEARHFYDPLHQRIYQTSRTLARQGRAPTGAALKTFFKADDGMEQVGGIRYLGRLAALMSPTAHIDDYAKALVGLWQARETARICQDATAKITRPAVDEGISSVIESLQLALTDVQSEGPQARPQRIGDLVSGVIETVQDAKNGKNVLPSTGLKSVDEIIGGWRPGNLLLIAGRPAMGKTGIALSMMRKSVVVNPGFAAAFFSLEMQNNECVLRMACEVASTDQFKIPYSFAGRGQINDAQLRALVRADGDIRTLPIFVDDTPARTVAAIHAETRRLKRDLAREGFHLGLVMVDHLRKVKDTGNYRNNANKSEGEKASDLKNMAKDLDVTVGCLVQLSRNVEQRENKRPMLSDLRDSGEIEEEADIVMFPFREHYYKRRQEPTGKDAHAQIAWRSELQRLEHLIENIIDKNRQGSTGVAHNGCDMATNRFWDLTETITNEDML